MLTLIRLTKGGITISEVEDMFLDEFYEWLEAATELQADINRAMKAK
ncbi:hypothetical protein S58_16860 [Bradyrhizobium oligotrophicum S58]|uniref:Uncharacterized protein n=1 Tax=Bradyrhizobium oligotrophicum S58 TaxID=1245469 RepID=M4Z3P3_9BRAD|nr:hypothetical protein [Bradyrhizobium oligotrophicum]BAM87694.1 hypothetical protein S58_16860 [Bradyrhizobium oligotrophicum S58]